MFGTKFPLTSFRLLATSVVRGTVALLTDDVCMPIDLNIVLRI